MSVETRKGMIRAVHVEANHAATTPITDLTREVSESLRHSLLPHHRDRLSSSLPLPLTSSFLSLLMGSEIIDHEVTSLTFGFYSEEEIRALSVCRVSSSHSYDTLGTPVPHGLYDPSLGPIERADSCVTCGQSHSRCMGHLGHVELGLPVYQPFLFDFLVKLMRGTCWHCHCFRLPALKVHVCQVKLMLVEAGLLRFAMELDQVEVQSEAHKVSAVKADSLSPRKNTKQESRHTEKNRKKKMGAAAFVDDEATENEIEERGNEQIGISDILEEEQENSRINKQFKETIKTNVGAAQRAFENAMTSRLYRLSRQAKHAREMHIAHYNSPPPLNSADLLYRNGTIGQFFRDIIAQKTCAKCGALSPKLRKEGFNKIFRLPLSKKDAQRMEGLGIKLQLHILGEQKRDLVGEADAIRRANEITNSVARRVNCGNVDTSDVSDLSSDEDNPADTASSTIDLPENEVTDISDKVNNPISSSDDAFSKRPAVLLFPSEIEKHLELLFQNETPILSHIWGCLLNQPCMKRRKKSIDHCVLFIRCIAVPPSRFRPVTRAGDMVMEHPHNAYLQNILDLDTRLRTLISETSRDWTAVIQTWLQLQDEVNLLLDSSKGPNPSFNSSNGIRQTFEKKEGLFRRNMMGKRVNFAARSVISPDPFLNTNEIGVPELFAISLTFPEPVTHFNAPSLRQAVINGAHVYPGANFIEDEKGHLINLATRSTSQRIALANTLLMQSAVNANNASSLNQLVQNKCVLRHIRTGDVMLVNRQPTLHKPSMMTHRVRVLRGRNKMWQTIRMHYCSCNSYNADFDGDEMNLHVPQNQLARAEAYHISNTDNQYVVPTDGSPLRGLIQDNVLTGVLLTNSGTWLTRAEFQQLLFSSIEIDPTYRLSTPAPAILKPQPLWSGKQLISSILNLLTHGRQPLNLDSKAKVAPMHWAQHKEEATVIIRQNELCTGALDKSQFGDAGYGLVHAVYELYGASTTGQLLSTLGRLFTLYLQGQAFTCGIDDMLLKDANETIRRQLIAESAETGIRTAANFAGLDSKQIPRDIVFNTSINRALQAAIQADHKASGRLDAAMKGALNPFTTKIFSSCLPVGQYKPFPVNGMSLMTLTGAKGSAVNFYQISCLLGQQELEGKRVPTMATGKTLPCFRRYDPQPRAGGYVTDRFLTGIRPQEYFFHCMAGREGLIDTAVKTSRSGYLQRCLIKHLESLTVCYDYTVRDSDASIVQFHYGEDSIDVSKNAYLGRFSFLTHNWLPLVQRIDPSGAFKFMDTKAVDAYRAKYSNVKLTDQDPLLSVFSPGLYVGSVSESFERSLEQYLEQDPDGIFLRSSQQIAAGKVRKALTPEKFRALMKLHYASSLVQPGESVGILAAQSLGEPSTQMTLNTFHLAGHGGANVTLGIPRLREIIMTASARIKTPIMDAPMLEQLNSKQEAENIAAMLNRLQLGDFVKDLIVNESLAVFENKTAMRVYTIRLSWRDEQDLIFKTSLVNFEDLRRSFTKDFVLVLHTILKKEINSAQKLQGGTATLISRSKSRDDGEIREHQRISQDELGQDAVAEKEHDKRQEKASYGNMDEEEKELLQEDMLSDADVDDEEDNEVSQLPQSSLQDVDDDEDKDVAVESDKELDQIVSSELDKIQFRVLNQCTFVRAIRADEAKRWCEVEFVIPLSLPKLLVMSLAENSLEKCVLRSTYGIMKSFVVEKNDLHGKKRWTVQTDGVNFKHLRMFADSIDLSSVYSNDIAAILREYGVEAARTAIVSEVGSVFKPYGISVDLRHLSLIADYMTMNGDYRPLNRGGIDANTSTFQKVSFETSMHFMRQACLTGDTDYLNSPSANIVMGKPVKCGTGAFTLLQPLMVA